GRYCQGAAANQVSVERVDLRQEGSQDIQLHITQIEAAVETLGAAGVGNIGLDIKIAEPVTDQLQPTTGLLGIELDGEFQVFVREGQWLVRVVDPQLTVTATDHHVGPWL